MRIAFYTLGCKVNQVETQALAQRFAELGYELVADSESADVYVLNSCTVTAEGDKKARRLLRRFRRQNPEAKLALIGCMPQAYPDVAAAVPEADIISGARDKGSLPELVRRALETGRRVTSIVEHDKSEEFEELGMAGAQDKTRAFIKIQDGCTQFCAYCIIPFARGPLRSKQLQKLRAEIEELAQRGYREVVLTGINLSLYGRQQGLRLVDAVETACAVSGIERVRLGSLEPELIDAGDIERMSRCEKLCPQFHLALQSGCDSTLERMNRHYTTAQYLEIAQKLRDSFENAAITTDIMVGFPGESDEEFAQTLDFVEQLGLARAHVFSYSQRAGTAAATMPNQIPAAVRERRSRILQELTNASRERFYRSQVGRVERVLIEKKQHPDYINGYTENYTPIKIAHGGDLRGQIVQVKITAAGPEGCAGEIL